jgi:hypothetical protein
MALYSNGLPSPSSAAPTPTVILNGRGFKRRHLDAQQRAHLAAEWVCGDVQLRPSLQQAASLFEVLVPQVREHLKARNGGGTRRPADPVVAELLRAWSAADPAQRLSFARGLGAAAVWDEVIVPLTLINGDLAERDLAEQSASPRE